MSLISSIAQAQVPELNMTTALVIYGPMGGMIAWFMLRAERSLRTLSHRIDGMTRALLVDVISRDTAGVHAKNSARQMLAEIEAKDEKK